MGKPFIHFMRGGAPDKINAFRKGYDYLIHDNVNLVDYTKNEIEGILSKGEYIFPADEGDILHLNKLGITNCERIFLPQTKDGNVIDYWKFVPKNADLYKVLESKTSGYMKYMEMTSYTPLQFIEEFNDGKFNGVQNIAIKTTVGSGSRGVRLISKERHGMSREYVDKLTRDDAEVLYNMACDMDCDICTQGLIPIKTKVNCDFIIRDGKLLGYKWDETPKDQTSTNWNWGYFIHNEFTDAVMGRCTEFLTGLGVWNAIMNFEGFSDSETELYVIEFNWRMSNSNFEHEALGIDFIANYLERVPFEVEMGKHKFARYWRCCLYSDIPNYVNGKDLNTFRGTPREVLTYIGKTYWNQTSEFFEKPALLTISGDGMKKSFRLVNTDNVLDRSMASLFQPMSTLGKYDCESILLSLETAKVICEVEPD